MRGTDLNMIERPYDGCGKCLLGVRRLSRMKLATSSPERQREDVLTAAASVGGHIIGWADDWEVSGATDPMTRPKLGPWLRDERGPYDGLVAAAVDRLGRNVVDCLNTGYKMRDEGKLLVTYGHDGPWDLDDQVDENRFTMEAWGAQMELRAIQRRNRSATEKTRAAGRPKGKPSYGFQYVRTVMGGKIDHVVLHPHASTVIRTVARRIVADPEKLASHMNRPAARPVQNALDRFSVRMRSYTSSGVSDTGRRSFVPRACTITSTPPHERAAVATARSLGGGRRQVHGEGAQVGPRAGRIVPQGLQPALVRVDDRQPCSGLRQATDAGRGQSPGPDDQRTAPLEDRATPP